MRSRVSIAGTHEEGDGKLSIAQQAGSTSSYTEEEVKFACACACMTQHDTARCCAGRACTTLTGVLL
eukprot:1145128-Pelagomonas_calceolata.AAC.1